jgi:ribA/ribD-fused uncharacterized protein
MPLESAAPAVEEIRFYRSNKPFGFMSNLYPAPIEFEGRTFPTSEHAYQFGKPAKPAVAEWIISAPKPHLVAAAAHALLSFDIRSDWAEIKVPRMREVLKVKFKQHPELAKQLLATGSVKLVEESMTDTFWGIGRNGKGKNMLGVLLMEVREWIRKEHIG